MSETPVDYEDKLLWSTVDEVHLDWIDGEPPMEDEVIAYQLWRAEDKILSEYPEMKSWVESGLVRAATVGRVAVGVAMRRLTNPRFQRSKQHGAGPFSENITVVGGDHPGEIYLSDSDHADLKPKRRGGRRAFSVMPNF